MELVKPVKSTRMLTAIKEPVSLMFVMSQLKLYKLMELARPVENSPMLMRTREPVYPIPALKIHKFY